MKWIIGGKRYDTETAKKVFSVLNVSFEESLYLSPNNQLFIFHEHNSSIELWNEQKALQWLEQHNAPESAYEAMGFEVNQG